MGAHVDQHQSSGRAALSLLLALALGLALVVPRTAMRLHASAVQATVSVGVLPAGVAVDPALQAVYVANEGDGTLSIIDATTDTVTRTISLLGTVGIGGSPAPVGVAVDSSNHLVFVAEAGAAQVAVIDPQTGTLRTEIATDSAPWGVAVDSATHTVYVAELSGTVAVIDGSALTLKARIGDPHFARPAGIAVNPTTHAVYIANLVGNSVSVIDGGSLTVTATIAVGSAPAAVAIDPQSGAVYVANSSANSVSVIDPTQSAVTATWTVGQGPLTLAVDTSTDVLYVAAQDGSVTELDASGATLATVSDPALSGLQGIAVDGGAVDVTAGASNALVVLPGLPRPAPPADGQ